MLKYVSVASELDGGYLKKNPNQLLYGALNAMTSKVVSKAQQLNEFQLPQAVLYIAGRMGEENYKTVMEMVEAYKTVEK